MMIGRPNFFKINCRIKWILSAIVILSFNPLSGQQSIVKGKVVSSEDQLSVIGATVTEIGTTTGTVTDIDGNFELSITSPQAILLFRFIGMDTVMVNVNGRSSLEILMQPSISILNEILITGYKSEIRSEVSTSIASIKSKDINKLVIQSVEQALQGQAPGVSVTQSTGAPGDDIAVRIRGAGTLGNNNPLYVIDGVPTTGNINMFSIGDIESIEILKDGAAAAIYGSRAANGVVLITTKRGAAGKASFSFDTYIGLQQAIRLPDLLNSRDYLTIRNEAITNANALRDPIRQLKTYDTNILDTLPDTDWLSKVFRTAPIRHYSLSGSGGGENNSFYLSGEYQTQDGIFKGQKFDKYQLRFNGNIGNKIIKLGNNFSFSQTNRKVIGSSGDGFGAGNELSGIRYALIAAPVFSPTFRDGSPVNVSSELGDPTLYGDGNANPLVFIDNTDWTIKRYRIFGNVFAEIFPIKSLRVRTSLGGDFLFENEKRFKIRLSDAVYNPTSLNENRVFNQTLIWNTTADYSLQLDKHKVSALLGMEAIKNHTDYLGASGNNFRRTDQLFRYLNDNLPAEINNVGASGIATEWSLLSYFTQAGYSYNSKYIVSASIRRDGSSRFGVNNRWGLFPSVSAAWNIANEPFLKEIKMISSLKLRASWGKLGNQEIGVYPYSSLVQTGERSYSFGDKLATGASIVETGNDNVKWETTTQKNIGLDVSIWKDRFSVIADLFDKKTEDILVRVPIPQSGGSQRPPYVNAGTIDNKGFELGLIYKNKSKDFNYTLGTNISGIKNKVVSIAGSEPILGGFGLSDGPLTRTEAGYSIGSFYLWKMDKLFQSQAEIDQSPFQTIDTRPGDVKFADLNGDNKIDDKDRAHVGNPFPDFTYGINLGFNYKRIDFSAFGQGIQGNDVYFLYGNFAYETQSRGFNSYNEILNRWTPSNTNTDIPKVSLDDRNGNRRSSTRFLEDGSYFRIRNITLGYELKDLLKIKQITSARIYITVQNAFTWTHYPGLDPEIQANANDTRGLGLSSDLAVGIDWGTVPAPRTQIIGFKINF